MIGSFHNGRIKDPVARRVEERRLRRLRKVKSQVKLHGLNRADRPSMKTLYRRTGKVGSLDHPRRRRKVPAVNQWDAENAENNENFTTNRQRKRPQKGRKKKGQKRRKNRPQLSHVEADDTDDLQEPAVESFENLWNFHSKRNGLQFQTASGATLTVSGDDDNDLEHVVVANDSHFSRKHGHSTDPAAIAAQQTTNPPTVSADDDDNAAGDGLALNEAANIAFQDKWSKARPIQIMGEAFESDDVDSNEDNREDFEDSPLRKPHVEPDSMFSSHITDDFAPPQLESFENRWASQGLPTTMDVINTRYPSRGRSQRSQDDLDLSTASTVSTVGDLITEPLLRSRGPALDVDELSHKLGLAKSASEVTFARPHYATRTKRRPAVLDPMIPNETKKRREKSRAFSAPDAEKKTDERTWRGGGAADAHVAEERRRVREVRRKEQKDARRRAREWRERQKQKQQQQQQQQQQQGKKVQKESNVGGDSLSQTVKETATVRISPPRASKQVSAAKPRRKVLPGEDQELISLKAEKDEAAALLNEVMGELADTQLQQGPELSPTSELASGDSEESCSQPNVIPRLHLDGVEPDLSDTESESSVASRAEEENEEEGTKNLQSNVNTEAASEIVQDEGEITDDDCEDEAFITGYPKPNEPEMIDEAITSLEQAFGVNSWVKPASEAADDEEDEPLR